MFNIHAGKIDKLSAYQYDTKISMFEPGKRPKKESLNQRNFPISTIISQIIIVIAVCSGFVVFYDQLKMSQLNETLISRISLLEERDST